MSLPAEEQRRNRSDSVGSSDSESSSDGWGESTDGSWSDVVEETTACLFCEEHAVDSHGIDLLHLARDTLALDQYGWLKLVNYLRKQGPPVETRDSNISFLKGLTRDVALQILESDADLFIPVMPSDALLMFDLQGNDKEEEDDEDDDDEQQQGSAEDQQRRRALLLQQLQQQQQQQEQQQQQVGSSSSNSNSEEADLLQRLHQLMQTDDVEIERVHAERTRNSAEDENYFDSYTNLEIHQEMIADRSRTDSYLHALERNSDHIKGKIVMDIGCGTGILSMFAARIGAAHVYAIEADEQMSKCAREHVEQNGFKDIVEVIHSKVEDIGDRVPACSVDVIVSEWMGYMLLFESMLDSVLWAAARYLQPQTGLMLPSACNLYCAPLNCDWLRTNRVDFWKSQYGFHFTAMEKRAEVQLFREPQLEIVPTGALLDEGSLLMEWDLQRLVKENVASIQTWQTEIVLRNPIQQRLQVDGFVVWFDCDFNDTVCLSTSPHATPTHWKQTVLVLQQPLMLQGGEQLRLPFHCGRGKHHRALNICISHERVTQSWDLV